MPCTVTLEYGVAIAFHLAPFLRGLFQYGLRHLGFAQRLVDSGARGYHLKLQRRQVSCLISFNMCPPRHAWYPLMDVQSKNLLAEPPLQPSRERFRPPGIALVLAESDSGDWI